MHYARLDRQMQYLSSDQELAMSRSELRARTYEIVHLLTGLGRISVPRS
jgi:hypothetical protein